MQFEQVFWNPNFGDYTGFDTVCEYARSGRHACSAVSDFLKSRAQIEETYAKQLLALAKSQAGVKMDGSLGRGWDSVLANAQRIAGSHQKLADVFSQQSQLTNQLAKTLKQKTKQREEEVRSCQTECRSLYEKALKNKTEFIKRADQKQSLEEEKDRLKKDTSPQAAKELQKLDLSIKKAIGSADSSKQQCAIHLEQLDSSKDVWETKTEQALTSFHEMEKNRILYLRSLLWVLMNAICQTCVEVDKECDTVRNVILKCDPDGDLEEFIASRKTGRKRPESITFENIGNMVVSLNAPSQRSFKMVIGKRLGNPWKSSNGQSTPITAAQILKTPPTPQKAALTQQQRRQSPQDDTLSSSDAYSSSASVSPVSPITTTLGEKKNGANGNGYHSSEFNAAQLKQQREAVIKRREEQQKSQQLQDEWCLVTKTWTDNQGTILVHGGSKAKLIEKANDSLWHIEIEDGQTLYCPVEYLQEIIEKQ